MRPSSWFPSIIIACLTVLACMVPQANAQTATLSVRAHTGNDTLYVGLPGAIVFGIDSNNTVIGSLEIWGIWRFSGNHVLGYLGPPDQPTHTAFSLDVFENAFIAPVVTIGFNPDTIWIVYLDFGGEPVWDSTGELCRLKFIPSDTSTLLIDLSTQGPVPSEFTHATNNDAETILLNYPDSTKISIVHCSAGNLAGGDANFDRVVSSSDIIYLVNYVFKSGTDPVIFNMGDTDCTGGITASDIIALVGFVFKSGPPPCDPCTTVP